ncbi:heme acquisition protein HasA [Luteimonas sp. Y-2-2-4F]|nr:heme acquisition protein HasA [Luteimonas sp. Y-2-2-4F]MCD9030776.1 heme acquisition protein HasA [Luteimonas sp. Y-2-2-4F]
MSAYVTQYNETLFPEGGYTVNDPLFDVLRAFDDSGVAGEHTGVPNYGGFWGGDAFSGTSYGFTSATVDGYAFVATGNLTYDFPTHTLWGSLESITLGAGVTSTGEVVSPFLTIEFDAALQGTLAEGRANVVHDVLWGLMNGSVDGASDSAGTVSPGGLIAALEDQGVTAGTTVADLYVPGAADLVGDFAVTETEYALAA